MPIVYMATNVINGKRYIGATKHSLDHRRNHHLSAARRTTHGCRVFGSAIRKYGNAAFSWSILSTHETIDDMISAEIEAIKVLCPEYNMTAGGKGLIGLARTPEWTAKAAASNRGKKRTPEQIAKIKAANKSKNYKKIICLDDGLIHESILAAAAYYNISKKGISEACCGRGLSANGKYFAHYHDGFMDADRLAKLSVLQAKKANRCVNSAKVRSRPVICVTDGRWHASGRAAAKAYGVHASAIMYFCQTGGQSKSGLRFMYADQGKPVERQPIAPEVRMKSIQALRKSTDSRKKKIRNLDDGIVYESVTAAGKALSRSSGDISATIQRNGRCAGKRLAYAA